MTDAEAIKALVGTVEISEVQSNPGALNAAVERAIGKILDHYDLTFRPIGIHWRLGGVMQTEMMLVPKPKAEDIGV